MHRDEWEAIYAEHARLSPVDQVLQQVTADLTPGTALDLGCGIGQNSIWLAERGWTVTGADFSTAAIEQSQAAAEQAGVAIDFRVADVTKWRPDGAFDLVFSTFAMPKRSSGRERLLAMAASAVAPDGTLYMAEFDQSLAGESWLAPDDLLRIDEVLDHLDGFDIQHAAVEMTTHTHGDDVARYPVAVVVATRIR